MARERNTPADAARGRRRVLSLTLGSLAAFAVLIGLGTWQIQRLHWKEGLIAERTTAMSVRPADVPRSLDIARALDFHRVQGKGHFLYDREIAVHAIERQNGSAGYLVLTPMRLDDGMTVWVARGWVPPEKRDAATRAAGNPAGDVTVEGLLRLARPEKPGSFIPENDPARKEWFWIDLPALTRSAGLAEALPFYIEAGPAPNPGGFPVGGQANTDLPNDHLQYAITWYALAGALAVIYLLLLRRERARKPSEPS